jgi:hypothetical protein
MKALLTSTAAVGLLALALALLWSSDQAAAEPTEAQVAAIKANCRSDYMSYCWSVPRGGPEAAQCLKKNLAKLSPACQQAVNAATAAAAPAAPAAPATAAKPPETPAVPPAPPPAAAAVPPAASSESAAADSADKVPAPASAADSTPAAPPSPAPAQPETTAKAAAPAPAAPGTPPAGAAQDAAEASPSEPAATAAVPPATTAPLGFIPPRKKLILLRTCNAELKSFCADVSYGGGRAITCLQENEAALTPECRQALAKVVH